MDKSLEEYYIQARDRANDSMTRSATSLDNIVLIITTGGLVLTVTAYSSLGVTPKIWSLMLICADILLLMALLLHNISYWSSVSSNRKFIDRLDEWHDQGLSTYDAWRTIPKKETVSNAGLVWGRSRIDTTSFILTWLGVIIMAISIFNGVVMNNTKNNVGDRGKSADNVLPTPPTATPASSGTNESTSQANNRPQVTQPDNQQPKQ